MASEKEILTKKDSGVFYIILNRPKRKNAVSKQMYLDIPKLLEEADQDPEVILTVITGVGEFFSSGNDLNNAFKNGKIVMNSDDSFRAFILGFIKFSKVLIGLVNGPAIGIGVTMLAHCDVVYAADSATFHTPFSTLGLSSEGCSSLTFPLLMGNSRASEVLMFGRKLTAEEACHGNLVSHVFPSASFREETSMRIKQFLSAPSQGLVVMKKLSRSGLLNEALLRKVNEDECVTLQRRRQSQECTQAVERFFASKL